LVIQELNARHGKKLLKLGAKGLILMGAESPLFSYYFYDNLSRITKNFKVKMLFDGVYELTNNKLDNTNNLQFYFPSYFSKDKILNKNWDARGFMTMIAANKFSNLSPPKNPKELLNFIIHFVYRKTSRSFKISKNNELHTQRLKCVEFFGNKNLLSLYGANWDNFSNFKNDKSLIKALKDLKPSFAENKITTLSEHKFAICFENIAFDGYITEKIIHCFLAGTIPIYFGAKNITKYIPSNAFIDFRDFKTLDELHSYLESINNDKAEIIIENGANFLKSINGKKYSYEGFSKNILSIIHRFDDNNK
jgi:hypothetical protein